MACLEWKKTAPSCTDKNLKQKESEITEVDDDTPSTTKLHGDHKPNVGKKPKSSLVIGCNHVKDHEIDSPRPRTTLHQHLFCSVPPIVDDESGPINAALWEEHNSRINNSIRRNDNLPIHHQSCTVDAVELRAAGSPRTVLEGPELSGSGPWSEFSSKKSLLNFSFNGDEGASDASGLVLCQPSQRHCMQSLWRSFATRKWQSFPSSYRKKELSISEPVLLSPPSCRYGGDEIGASSELECVEDLLSVDCSAKRSWQTFSYDDLSLATNNFDPGEWWNFTLCMRLHCVHVTSILHYIQ